MAVVKRKNEADFLAAVVREFAQWLSLEPHLFALSALRSGCCLLLDQVPFGGKTAGRESLPAISRRRNGQVASRIPADEETLRKRNLLGGVAPAHGERGDAR